MRKLKKLFGVFATVLLCVAVTLFGAVIVQKTTGISVFSCEPVWVLSDSMAPTIEAGSYILIQKIDAADVRKNDVITFVSDDPEIYGQLNTHRVLQILPDGNFLTQGDNNQGPDSYPARANAVVGRYVRNMPVLTFFGRMFASRAGIVLAATALFFLTNVALAIFTAVSKKKNFDRLVREEVARLEREDAQK